MLNKIVNLIVAFFMELLIIIKYIISFALQLASPPLTVLFILQLVLFAKLLNCKRPQLQFRPPPPLRSNFPAMALRGRPCGNLVVIWA